VLREKARKAPIIYNEPGAKLMTRKTPKTSERPDATINKTMP